MMTEEYYPMNTKLSQVAEDWQKSRGLPVPEKGEGDNPDEWNPEYRAMYEEWVEFAFEGWGDT